MDDFANHQRKPWTARISIQPSIKDAVQRLAREEMVPMAYLIGTAIAEYVTARSTA